MVAIDLHSMEKNNNMEVNVYRQLFDYQHSSNIFFVFNSWKKFIQV